MKNGEGQFTRRTSGILNANQPGGPHKEEPFRNYAGWTCSHCGSGNTIIEGYPTGPEGYCMSCTREQPIPQEHLDAYYANKPG